MLKSLIDEFIRTGVDDKLLDYLASNSNLPGPRGNLELAAAFANSLVDYDKPEVGKIWKLCLKMTSISSEEAPVNSAREFIPFCGTVGIGSIAAANPAYFEYTLSILRELANDTRWRMREAVAMSLQKLIASNARLVFIDLQRWIEGGRLLELRAVAAGVAEPALLKSEDIAKAAFRLNQEIIQKLRETEDRKSENVGVLRRALGYTLSVVIVPLPKEGLEYLRKLVKVDDPDIKWILKENLKKNRLVKNFPMEVDSLKKLLN